MYKIIQERKSVPDVYADKLIEDGVVPAEYFADQILQYNEEMSTELAQADKYQPKNFHFKDRWSSCRQARDDVITTWDTGKFALKIKCGVFYERQLGA